MEKEQGVIIDCARGMYASKKKIEFLAKATRMDGHLQIIEIPILL